jgi:hypothetical protein
MCEKPRAGPAREGHPYLSLAMHDNCLDAQLEDFLFDEDLRVSRVIVMLESDEKRPAR